MDRAVEDDAGRGGITEAEEPMRKTRSQGNGLDPESDLGGAGNAGGARELEFDVGLVELVLLSVLASYLLFASEWLFFVTKPSMFNQLSTLRSIAILLISPLFTLPWVALGCGVLALIWLLMTHLHAKRWCKGVALAMPTAILTTVELLLIENLTQTLFGFNLGSFTGPLRYLYAVGILGLASWTLHELGRLTSRSSWAARRRALPRLVAGLVAVSLGAAGLQLALSDREELDLRAAQGTGKLPNIVILSAESLLASHMSAWDDYRQTTPFLDEFTKETLLFENSFTNAANSTGSVAALMTGKLPTRTRVIYAPDRLRGRDSFEHLPGILRRLGYRSADFSMIHYSDAFDMNIRDGFDMANGRREEDQLPRSLLPRALELAFESEIFFYGKVRQRASERLLHAFGIRDLVDPYDAVTQLKRQSLHRTFHDMKIDDHRVKLMLDFLGETSEPFFVHLHCQGTHGWKYAPKHRRYSRGKKQDDVLLDDFYDDAITDFDFVVKQVVNRLKKMGIYDDTLIVITSDHGKPGELNSKTRNRIPLAIKFPHGTHRGRRSVNTQRIDVAPTILDVLGIEPPSWMQGRSLLSDDIDPLRPIVSSHVAERRKIGKGFLMAAKVNPPFWSLGHVGFVQCHTWFRMDLGSGKVIRVDVSEHTAPCPEEDLFTTEQARSYFVEHMREAGYDVSSLVGE